MRRIVFGLFLVGGALTVFLVERFANNVVSDGIGRLYCGDDYLAPIAGVVSDASCGFNTDLYLVILLSFLIYVGFTVVMFSLLRRRRLKRELFAPAAIEGVNLNRRPRGQTQTPAPSDLKNNQLAERSRSHVQCRIFWYASGTSTNAQ